MTKLVIRIVINIIAFWLCNEYIPGIEVNTELANIVTVAIVFGLVNAIIRPIISVFACPLYALTLGLFTFIVNAGLLLLTDTLISQFMGQALALAGLSPRFADQMFIQVEGIESALMGGVVIGIVSLVLGFMLDSNNKK
ncbi:MAG: phage holin family protein [Chloroflexota bacterium]